MSQPEHADSPHDTLIKALERVGEMKKVLVIWESDDRIGAFDSDLTIAEALYLGECFK